MSDYDIQNRLRVCLPFVLFAWEPVVLSISFSAPHDFLKTSKDASITAFYLYCICIFFALLSCRRYLCKFWKKLIGLLQQMKICNSKNTLHNFLFIWIIRRENYTLVNWKTTIRLKENMHLIHVNHRSHVVRSTMQFIYLSQRFELYALKTALMFPFANGIQYSAPGLGWETLPRGTDLKVCF